MDERQSLFYDALFELTDSISGHDDLDGLFDGLSRLLRQVVDFEFLVLILYDHSLNLLLPYALSTDRDMRKDGRQFEPTEDNPIGWVWLNQKPLLTSFPGFDDRWKPSKDEMMMMGMKSAGLVPVTTGTQRLGVMAFGRATSDEPDAEEMAFLQRVASELAVTVKVFFVQKQLVKERDRLRVLFDITNAIVSKLSPDEVGAEISRQLRKVISYDSARMLLFLEEKESQPAGPTCLGGDGGLEVEIVPRPGSSSYLGHILSIGTGAILDASDMEQLPGPIVTNPEGARFVSAGLVPLVSPNGVLGVLIAGRTTGLAFEKDEMELLAQVSRQIAIAIDNSLAYRQLDELKDKLTSEKLYLEDEIRLDLNPGNMIGDSPAFRAAMQSVRIVAPTDSTVLVLGETGTGKELIARAIHDSSPRRDRSFVKLNCAAIPAPLLESELFGHEKGAFTGAFAQKPGRFELAHKGTLFLDEIGDFPLELQSKLLRAIQEQEIERLGGTRTIRVDVRIIAATNRDLKAMVNANTFRSDLYYRLNVFPITVPPLRERREDIPLLVRYFVQKYSKQMGRQIDSVPADVIEALETYDWPGNIRELQNLIERSVILTSGSMLRFPLGEVLNHGASDDRTRRTDDMIERERILKALEESSGVVGGSEGAAARLGLKRTTLQSRMKKLGINRVFA